MANDIAKVMGTPGYNKFSVISHDRGEQCGYRLALDFPHRLEKLVVLEIVPTHTKLSWLDARGAYGGFHWYFMGQEPGFPEKLIGANPEFYFTFCAINGPARKIISLRKHANKTLLISKTLKLFVQLAMNIVIMLGQISNMIKLTRSQNIKLRAPP